MAGYYFPSAHNFSSSCLNSLNPSIAAITRPRMCACERLLMAPPGVRMRNNMTHFFLLHLSAKEISSSFQNKNCKATDLPVIRDSTVCAPQFCRFLAKFAKRLYSFRICERIDG